MKQFNRHFRRQYRRLFKQDPMGANLFMLLAELADERGQVHLGPDAEAELVVLMQARFENPAAFQFSGRPK